MSALVPAGIAGLAGGGASNPKPLPVISNTVPAPFVPPPPISTRRVLQHGSLLDSLPALGCRASRVRSISSASSAGRFIARFTTMGVYGIQPCCSSTHMTNPAAADAMRAIAM
jgi:hypothetical protein